jgi:hypothetical protein
MADPLEGVLDQIDPNAPQPEPVAPPEVNTVTIDKDELARLQQTAAQIQEVAPVLEQLRNNPNLIHDMRARAIEQAVPPQPTTDENADFWQNPTGSTAKIAAQISAQQNRSTNMQLGAMIVNNYKLQKQSSEFYHVCTPIFDSLIANLDRAQLAQTDPSQITFILDAAWNSAVGTYTQKKLSDRKNNPPANLGAGGSSGTGGGLKAKKTLQELDPSSYTMAVNAGLSEEEMQAIADSQTGGEE